MSSDKIRAIANRAENKASYPASQLGNSLKLVAKLIGGGLPTRVFYVSRAGTIRIRTRPGRMSGC